MFIYTGQSYVSSHPSAARQVTAFCRRLLLRRLQRVHNGAVQPREAQATAQLHLEEVRPRNIRRRQATNQPKQPNKHRNTQIQTNNQTIKQTNNQTSKQSNKQITKQTTKQRSERTNKQRCVSKKGPLKLAGVLSVPLKTTPRRAPSKKQDTPTPPK